MNDVNQVTITGRLARKPEARTTPSGTSVADIVVVTHRWMKTSKEEKSTFVRCALWNKQAEYASSKLDKGDHVLINGQLADDNYTPQGEEKPTRGRLKLDNCRIQVIAKVNSSKEEAAPVAEPEDDSDGDASPDPLNS